MTFRWQFQGSAGLSIAAVLTASILTLVTGCGPSSVSPDENAPAVDVEDATVGVPFAVGRTGDPASGGDPAKADPAGAGIMTP